MYTYCYSEMFTLSIELCKLDLLIKVLPVRIIIRLPVRIIIRLTLTCDEKIDKYQSEPKNTMRFHSEEVSLALPKGTLERSRMSFRDISIR